MFPVSTRRRGAVAGGVTQTIVAQGAGTPLGDMSAAGGLASAFDSVTDQAEAASAGTPGNSTIGYLGKDWGVATTKKISGFVAYATNNNGFHNPGLGGTITITLQGSTDNFGGSIVGLGSSPGDADANSLVITKLTGLSAGTGYRYHRLKIESDGGVTNMLCAEVIFYEDL